MTRFYWVRTYDQYNGWSTFYEGWEEPLARDYIGRTQAGSYVIADIFSVDQNRWLPREVWQSYSPHAEPGKPRDIESTVDPKCKPPTRTDPVLAAESMKQLRKFIASGVSYGAVSYEVIGGRRYAFRYAEHPPDAGINAPHPGVDYLECGAATVAQGGETDWGMIVLTTVALGGTAAAFWFALQRAGRR